MPAINQPKFLFWNAQSITNKSKLAQLEYILQSERIDILLLVETFLKPPHSFKLNNFIVYRNDRLTHPHGGVAIAVRDGLSHKIRMPFNTSSIENIAIEVLINNIPTCITAAYSPKYSIHFANDIQALTSLNTQFLLFGDFNAKHTSWNCNNNNRAGNSLFSTQQSSHFMIYHTPNHTHFPHSGQTPSTIDLLLANVNFAFDITTHINQISSDHAPVICNVSGPCSFTPKKVFDYAKANWNKFRRSIDNRINDIPAPSVTTEIDIALSKFTDMITSARSLSVPLSTSQRKSNISAEAKRLIQHKNYLKRIWQRTHTSPLKQLLKSELNKLQKLINSTVSNDINSHWHNQLSNLKKADKKVWKLAKQFRGKSDTSISKIKIDGSVSIDDGDRANCLAQIFAKSHSITADFSSANDTVVRNTLNNFNAYAFLNCQTPVIEVAEVHQIIKSMKPFKSPGPDTIQNVLLKQLPNSAIDWLTNTINFCFKHSYWPAAFKTAKVIPIPKAGKSPSDPHSYRPISLLNVLGKILEKIVQKKLIDFIEDKKLLPDYQFGFRRGHSTTHQAMRIKRFITSNKQRKRSTGLLLLDIEKAFDSVWHDGLVHKLIKMKFPTFLTRMLNAFVRDRKFAVQVNDASSNRFNIPAGLPQGSCISPILYALYIADLQTESNVEIALYADDTGIYTAAKQSNTIINRLNESLHSIQQYFHKWKIKINANKTQAILFTFDGKRRRIPSNQIKYNNHTIELQKSVNYLGITFDTKLTFKEHITKSIEKSNKCFRALFPLLASKSRLSSINKTLIYTSVIRPIIAYGSPVWVSAARTHTHKLNILQNKILKTIFRLPRRTPSIYLKRITGIEQLNKFIASLNANFILSCNNSDFNLIREIDSM